MELNSEGQLRYLDWDDSAFVAGGWMTSEKAISRDPRVIKGLQPWSLSADRF